jgi:cellulose synthase/poly-beta-1,6-N-acetylglucosamine synthase-like glycosyltransferase
MHVLKTLSAAVALFFIVCYSYQTLYIPISLLARPRRFPAAAPRNYAVLVCACNERSVIADLIGSLRRQTYPQEKIHVFVLADNCTDDTAAVARAAGATVYERQNRTHIGKGYALNSLMRHLERDYPAGFDGYFVFDADNLLAADYIERMNEAFAAGNDIVTGYRNSKNYGDNWVSAGHSLWFLWESRILSGGRSALGLSCAVSGTGFLFSRAVAREMGPWPYHTLTEDIEFSVDQILRGRRIALCPEAELYDEQPLTFAQSWNQRLRWMKGGLQVFRRYGLRLLRAALLGSLSCYDIAAALMPAFLLSALGILCALAIAVLKCLAAGSLLPGLIFLWTAVRSSYFVLLIPGAVVTASEWRRIHTSLGKKLLYILTFPLYLYTALPIAVASLFCRVEWKHISHDLRLADIRRRRENESLPL